MIGRRSAPGRRMRGHRLLAGAGAGVAAIAIAAVVVAQSASGFDLSFSAITGGGGTSTGGSYALTGAIGQPVAASSSGGQYKLDSGMLGGGGAGKYLRFFTAVARDGAQP